LDGIKRSDDEDCKKYIEEGYNAVLQSDSEDKRPETPEKTSYS